MKLPRCAPLLAVAWLLGAALAARAALPEAGASAPVQRVDGVPCVGVTGRSMDEIIVPEETGLLVPPDDVAALAAALLRLLADPETRRAWGRAGRRRVEQFFTWPQVVERMLPELIQAARRGVGV